MKWYKTRDKLPSDQQEVLVKCRGVVNLARFSISQKTFLLRNDEAVSVDLELIEWMELISPEPV